MDMIKTLAVTGYRPWELGIFSEKHPGIRIIQHVLYNRMRAFAEEGTEWFVTSGQPGVEWWAAEAVHKLKAEFPDVKLSVLMPFLEQEARWPEAMKEKYFEMLARADHVAAITRRPYESPAQLRLKNDFIVQKTDGLLIVYDEDMPGSPVYFLRAAERRAAGDDYPVFYINRYDLEDAEREWFETRGGGDLET